jgi:hypothetical protein
MRLTIALAVILYSGAAASVSEAGTSIAIFGADPGTGRAFACYTRVYDAAHLKAHPKQNVTDMLLLVSSLLDPENGRQYTADIGVKFRSTPARRFQADSCCSISDDGKSALNCPIDCDGGQIDVRLRDAKSLLVSIPDGAQTWDPDSPDAEPDEAANNGAHFGADDKLFRLDRSTLSDCLSLSLDDDTKAALTAAANATQ